MKNIFLSIAMMASVSAFAQQKASIEIYPEKGNRPVCRTSGYMYIWRTLGWRRFGHSKRERLQNRRARSFEKTESACNEMAGRMFCR